ncbi:hypothetical protein AW76_06030 [Salmonella enterica subsp. enterica serovar Montevideo str. CDC 2013K-0218]|nr:hypothetical protein AW76_06030 [Salmonella enterica subsp. enterica serovar Montevideo str. CDC 2013K-0218]
MASDFAGQIQGTKKPAWLAPCGLLGLHRMTLVITDGEFWWSWRELNPRPKFLHTIITFNKTTIYLNFHAVKFTVYHLILYVFNSLPPLCRHSYLRYSYFII